VICWQRGQLGCAFFTEPSGTHVRQAMENAMENARLENGQPDSAANEVTGPDEKPSG